MVKKKDSRIDLYLDDAREQLETVEQHLLLFEQAGDHDLGTVNEIFRGIHTVKGGADFLGLNQIKLLSHAAEDVLDLVRNQSLALTRDGIGLLLVVTDTLKEMLADPDKAEETDISNLLVEIRALSQPVDADTLDQAPDSLVADSDSLQLGLSFVPALFEFSKQQLDRYREKGFNLYILEYSDEEIGPRNSADSFDSLTVLDEIGYLHECKGPLSVAPNKDAEEVVRHFVLFRTVLSKTLTVRYLSIDPGRIYSLRKGESGNIHSLDVVVMQSGIQDVGDGDSAGVAADDSKPTNTRFQTTNEASGDSTPQANSGRTNVSDNISAAAKNTSGTENSSADEFKGSNSIRVNVDILDSLMNLAGELVLTRNQLNQNVATYDEDAIAIAAQRLDTVTSELQESIMSTRMQPISIVLSRFHRVTRDMSQQLNKSINLVLEGEEVELDKSIIENIGDPLTHLVRNAVDHGVETPEIRRGKGKAEVGVLTIKARHEAGHVVIEVSDDGKGMDPNAIREQALEKGIIDRNRADEISDKELLRLIFLPGFTTAEQISDISGRGVGMDVVLTNISRLGGSIDVDSVVGSGTQFRIKLPLTLAIVPSLLVSVHEEVFAIPQVNLIELVRLPPGDRERVEYIGNSAVLRLRGKLLPIVWLTDFLGMEQQVAEADDENMTNANPDVDSGVVKPIRAGLKISEGKTQLEDSTNIVVVAAGDFHYGIVVDNLTDSEEIVVKPLGTHLRNCQGYAGATILGDGRAALILDVGGIAESVSLASQEEIDSETEERFSRAQDNLGNEEKLLVVENAKDEYFGIQLAYVNRIERIVASTIERVGDRNVVKYRGGVVRIFGLDEGLETREREEATIVYLVIFQMMGTEVAISVSNIIDIVDSDSEIDSETFQQPGVVGSTITMGNITLLLDLFALVRVIDPTMGAAGTVDGEEMSLQQRTILVVEDSMFFQDKLESLLVDMDINVMIAGDGQAGWETLDAQENEIDLVLMDIEMPGMNGLELTRKLRADARFTDLPVVMLTSLAKESDIEKGKEAGASDYLVKMDQEMVRQTIFKHFSQRSTKVA